MEVLLGAMRTTVPVYELERPAAGHPAAAQHGVHFQRVRAPQRLHGVGLYAACESRTPSSVLTPPWTPRSWTALHRCGLFTAGGQAHYARRRGNTWRDTPKWLRSRPVVGLGATALLRWG